MFSNSDQVQTSTDPAVSTTNWTRRLLIALTIVAYIIYPFVLLFQRVMPHPLAIVLVYLILLIVLSVLVYLVGVSFVQQLTALITIVTQLWSPEGQLHLRPFLNILQQIGIPKELFTGFGGLLIAQLRGLLSHALPY